jgi:hypothetical protein
MEPRRGIPAAGFPYEVAMNDTTKYVDTNDGAPWSEMDLWDLKNLHAHGRSMEEVAAFLCRSGGVDEVRRKAEELRGACHPAFSGARSFAAAVEPDLHRDCHSDPHEVTTCEPWPALAGAFPFGIPGRGNEHLAVSVRPASGPGDDSCDAQTCRRISPARRGVPHPRAQGLRRPSPRHADQDGPSLGAPRSQTTRGGP